MTETSVCMHCKLRIVKIEWFGNTHWMHLPNFGKSTDVPYMFCQLSVAEPVPEAI